MNAVGASEKLCPTFAAPGVGVLELRVQVKALDLVPWPMSAMEVVGGTELDPPSMWCTPVGLVVWPNAAPSAATNVPPD